MSSRLIVAIAGLPGSGKSTLAHQIHVEVSDSVVISMDGFHLFKHELQSLGLPLARRGAPNTFDPKALLEFLQNLIRLPDQVHYAPSFDHAAGDPLCNSIKVLPKHKIIIVEGLYLHSQDAVWNEIYDLANMPIFLDVCWDVCLARLTKRLVRDGLASTEQEAADRAQENDFLNGQYVLQTRNTSAQVIRHQTLDEIVNLIMKKANDTLK